MSYIIYGAGGHAKVVIDILRACDKEIVGVMDDNPQNTEWNGLSILGTVDQLNSIIAKHPDVKFIVAIGSNATRVNVVNQLKLAGVRFGIAIHPSAIIGTNVSIGEGTVLMPNVVINADTYIGGHTIINTAATVDHDCIIEHFVHISPGVHIAGGVMVRGRSHIGIGASLIPGVTVGSDTIVGAASCVIGDLPSQVIAVGCPAKVIKNL